MTDLAANLIGDRDIETVITGIRPGEKVHEILVSDEEATRTVLGQEGYYAVRPMLPELAAPVAEPAFVGEFSSANHLMGAAELADFLRRKIPEVMAQQSPA
jgi:UDP-glucose 4-epimerase